MYHDPYVPELKKEGIALTSEKLTDELLKGVDVAVILTDHSCFDYGRIVDGARALVDARHAVSGAGVITNGVDSWIVKS